MDRRLPAKNLRAAVLTVLLLGAIAVLAAGSLRFPGSGRTSLEARLERVLSCVEGAGEVRVLVHTKETGSAFLSAQGEEIVGVVIVASGAGDAAVVVRLAQAAGVALDLEQEAIEVFRMENTQ